MFVALTVYSTSAQVGSGQQLGMEGNYHGVGQIRIAPSLMAK